MEAPVNKNMMKFKAIDHYDGNTIIWPVARPGLKYDFVFRKIGATEWRYLNSSDEINAFDKQIQSTIDHGGECIILESRTGNAIKRG